MIADVLFSYVLLVTSSTLFRDVHPIMDSSNVLIKFASLKNHKRLVLSTSITFQLIFVFLKG